MLYSYYKNRADSSGKKGGYEDLQWIKISPSISIDKTDGTFVLLYNIEENAHLIYIY